MAQAATQRGIAVERAEIAQQLARAGEQDRVPLDQRLVGDVLGQGRLADAVGTDDDDIGGLLEEVERHQRLDGGAVAALGPVPVEVAQRLEAADMGGLQPTLQAAAGALLLFPVEQRRDPGLRSRPPASAPPGHADAAPGRGRAERRGQSSERSLSWS